MSNSSPEDLQRALRILEEVRALDDDKREVKDSDTIVVDSPGSGQFKIRMYRTVRTTAARGAGYYYCLSVQGPREATALRSVGAVESALVHVYGIDAASLGVTAARATAESLLPSPRTHDLETRAILRLQTSARAMFMRRASRRHEPNRSQVPGLTAQLTALRAEESRILQALRDIEQEGRRVDAHVATFVAACTTEIARVRDDALPPLLRRHVVFDGTVSTRTEPVVSVHDLVTSLTGIERPSVRAYAENDQRVSITPLQEARALGAMLSGEHTCIEDVAREIGRSTGYVRARVALLELIIPLMPSCSRHAKSGFSDRGLITTFLRAKSSSSDKFLYMVSGVNNR